MSQYQLYGGAPLCGRVTVGGSKNAALPILFAALSVSGISTIGNLPAIADVRVALSLLAELGAILTYEDAHTVRLDTRAVAFGVHDTALTAALRASTYLLGAELARFGESRLYDFGGCAFCPRPIDLHLYAIRAFGGVVEGDRIVLPNPSAAHVVFPIPSVGATVNALILAAHVPEISVLENVALEPHVMALVAYLRAAGAEITLSGHTMRVRGGCLHGVSFDVSPDMIEAGTYLLAGALTRGRVEVEGVVPSHLYALTDVLLRMGATVLVEEARITVAVEQPLLPVAVTAAPYPAFATDLAPLMGALLCTVGGGSVTDGVFPDRIGYTRAFEAMGARLFLDGARVCFLSPPIHGASVAVADLRGGAAVVLAALYVRDVTRLSRCEILNRGYEAFFDTLRSLGAAVQPLADGS